MADKNTPTVTLSSGKQVSLARERMVWALRPFGLLALVLWILHPATADKLDHTHTALLGFLFGAVYGLIIYGPMLRQYLALGQSNELQQANRVPEEYYWGQIETVMFDNT